MASIEVLPAAFLGVEVGPPFGGIAQLDDGHDVQRRLMRRFPARESRCRCWSPEEASRGAVPFQDANWSRSAKRWMSPTSTSSRAAPEGPIPVSVIRVEPRR